MARLIRRLGPPTSTPSLSIRETNVPVSSAGAALTATGTVINVYNADFPVVLDNRNTELDGRAAGEFIARNVPTDCTLYVAAHRDVPLRRLFAILAPLHEHRALRLIVRLPPRNAGSSEDAAATASRIRTALGACRDGVRVLASSSGRPPLQRANFLREQLPPALRRCGCQGSDVEQLGTLLEPLIASEPELRALPFRVSTSASGALSLAANATVDDLARAAANASRQTPTFHLELR